MYIAQTSARSQNVTELKHDMFRTKNVTQLTILKNVVTKTDCALRCFKIRMSKYFPCYKFKIPGDSTNKK